MSVFMVAAHIYGCRLKPENHGAYNGGGTPKRPAEFHGTAANRRLPGTYVPKQKPRIIITSSNSLGRTPLGNFSGVYKQVGIIVMTPQPERKGWLWDR